MCFSTKHHCPLYLLRSSLTHNEQTKPARSKLHDILADDSKCHVTSILQETNALFSSLRLSFNKRMKNKLLQLVSVVCTHYWSRINVSSLLNASGLNATRITPVIVDMQKLHIFTAMSRTTTRFFTIFFHFFGREEEC